MLVSSPCLFPFYDPQTLIRSFFIGSVIYIQPLVIDRTSLSDHGQKGHRLPRTNRPSRGGCATFELIGYMKIVEDRNGFNYSSVTLRGRIIGEGPAGIISPVPPILCIIWERWIVQINCVQAMKLTVVAILLLVELLYLVFFSQVGVIVT